MFHAALRPPIPWENIRFFPSIRVLNAQNKGKATTTNIMKRTFAIRCISHYCTWCSATLQSLLLLYSVLFWQNHEISLTGALCLLLRASLIPKKKRAWHIPELSFTVIYVSMIHLSTQILQSQCLAETLDALTHEVAQQWHKVPHHLHGYPLLFRERSQDRGCPRGLRDSSSSKWFNFSTHMLTTTQSQGFQDTSSDPSLRLI